MKYSRTLRATIILIGGLMLLAGCKSDNPPSTDGSSLQQFFPSYADRQVHKFQDVQIANGARADSTLLSYYFDGADLNVIGRHKLDDMVSDDPEKLTTIYMNFPESEMMDERRAAVLAYLSDKGIGESNLKFVSGPNPTTLTPAAAGLARINRAESPGTGDSASDQSAYVPASMTGSK